jgi:hypothetical protein
MTCLTIFVCGYRDKKDLSDSLRDLVDAFAAVGKKWTSQARLSAEVSSKCWRSSWCRPGHERAWGPPALAASRRTDGGPSAQSRRERLGSDRRDSAANSRCNHIIRASTDGRANRHSSLPHRGRAFCSHQSITERDDQGWFHPRLPGREQVSRFFPAHGIMVCGPRVRPTIQRDCPARDGAIPYAEAGSW